MALLQLVMEASPVIGCGYGVIFNDIPEKVVGDYSTPGWYQREKLLKSLFSRRINHTDNVFFQENIEGATYENDVFIPATPRMVDFIDSVPVVPIQKEKVADIRHDQFDFIKGKLEKSEKLVQDLAAEVITASDELARLREKDANATNELGQLKAKLHNLEEDLEKANSPSSPSWSRIQTVAMAFWVLVFIALLAAAAWERSELMKQIGALTAQINDLQKKMMAKIRALEARKPTC